MKIKKIKEQNISDILTNYGNLSNIYPFLVQEQIPYIKKGQLSKDFYVIDDTWRNQDSNFLIQNNRIVVNNDDEYYYPSTADNINFSNIKVDTMDISGSGDTYTYVINYTNYGYLKSGATIFIDILDSDDNLVDNDTFISDTLGYLDNGSYTSSISLTTTDTYSFVVYQKYNSTIRKSIYTKKIIL